jgi:hypothetical protein
VEAGIAHREVGGAEEPRVRSSRSACPTRPLPRARALACYERALALKPEYAEAAWNRALLWLLRGDYERGWPAYEWRWRCKRTTPLPPLTRPRWNGEPLDGRTILLNAEQGLGDTLQFIRYAPLVKARGGHVVVQCQNALLSLLSRSSGIDGMAGWGAPPPPHDVWLPLMSLPALFHSTVETIPAEVPYVFPDPALVAHWRRELAPVRGFRIGIVWQGSPRHPWDRHRSVSLEQFEPLARVEGAFFTPNTLDDNVNPNQQARVDIITTTANPFSVAPADVLLNVFQTQVGDPLISGYTMQTTDLSAFLAGHQGQTLRLRFAEVDNQGNFQFGVDRVVLSFGPSPSPAGAGPHDEPYIQHTSFLPGPAVVVEAVPSGSSQLVADAQAPYASAPPAVLPAQVTTALGVGVRGRLESWARDALFAAAPKRGLGMDGFATAGLVSAPAGLWQDPLGD